MVDMQKSLKIQYSLIARSWGLGGGKNQILIGKNVRLNNCRFILERGVNNIIIGDNVYIDQSEFICSDGFIIIGDKSTFGSTQFMAREGSSIKIGKDCMFSYNIKVFSCDGHPFYDKNGRRINSSKDINICEHVWVGNTAFILKGAYVPSGSIMGAGSRLSSFASEESCIYAGNPARCLRHEVRWERK